MNNRKYKIHAYKPSSAGADWYHTSCGLDDPDANMFRINYFVHSLGFDGDIEVDDRRLAEQIISVMNSSYEDGRADAFRDVRDLIGVK